MAGKIKQLQSPQLINPERKPLTKEKLRELSGLDLSDAEAEKTIDFIRLLAKILYDFTNQNHLICIDNQQIVNLKEQNSITKKQAA